MSQLAFSFDAPREVGRSMGELCADKAERVSDFDTDAAGDFIATHLRSHGAMSGEALTDAAIAAGFKPHDQRAFGPVYAGLVRRGRIECVGFVPRSKGHGTAGGRLWAARDELRGAA